MLSLLASKEYPSLRMQLLPQARSRRAPCNPKADRWLVGLFTKPTQAICSIYDGP
jgi:hypothetical protein